MKKLLALLLVLQIAHVLKAQEIIPLYAGIVPNSKASTIKERTETSADGAVRISTVSEPTLKVFRPSYSKWNSSYYLSGWGLCQAFLFKRR